MRFFIYRLLLLLITSLPILSIYSCAPKPPPPNGFTYINPPDDVCSIAINKTALWAGGKDGLFKIPLNGNKAEHLLQDKDISYVRALLIDSENNLWVGHILGLLCLKNGKVWKDYTENLPDKRVNCLYRDSQNRIWIGTWGGVTLFDGKTFKTYTKKDGLINNMVNAICEDRKGRMWFGSYVAPAGGISVLDNGKFLQFTREDGLPHADITSITATDQGVWIGTGLYQSGGAILATVKNQHLKILATLHKKDGLAGEKVRTIFIDSTGNTWFGSEYDGLAIFYKNGKKKILTTKNGLCNSEVKCIIEDNKGCFWLGTRNGITKIDPDYE